MRRVADAVVGLALAVGILSGASPAGAQLAGQEGVARSICRLIESAAGANDLPVDFLTRLIWRESSFRHDVTSRAGAQGIAQFMPGTAAERGLADPFDPEAAIPASAAYLATLKARFGNLGLAAAAYNTGPTRLARWRARGGFLPLETETYVAAITGRPVADWADGDRPAPSLAASGLDCVATVAAIRTAAPTRIEGIYSPFGVQISGNFSKARALASYQTMAARFPRLLAGRPTLVLGSAVAGRGRRAFYRVRVAAQTLREAAAFCGRLRAAGGNCAVLRN